MKIDVLIFCTVTTGATLYGSTTELPVFKVRQQIVDKASALAARTFIKSSKDILSAPDHFIESVHEFMSPLIQGNDIHSDIVQHAVYFLEGLINQLQKKYPEQSAYITQRLAHLSFDGIYSYNTIHNIPILNIATLLIMPNVVKTLLDAGANPNAADANDTTPLIIAAQYAVAKENVALFIIQQLLDHGAQPGLTDRYLKKTARGYALQAGNTEVAELLRTAELDLPDKSDTDQ